MSHSVNVRICISNLKTFLFPQDLHYSSLCLVIKKPQISTVETDAFHKKQKRYDGDKYYSITTIIPPQQHPFAASVIYLLH